MKTLEITEASLDEYDAKGETWVLTRDGKPVAAVVPIRPGMDAETFAMSHNPDFIEIVNRSWKSYKEKGGLSLDEVRRRHGLERKPARRESSRRSR
jgi:antitoxin (DNA-binding transcriptional repressor) of toxin-antitoxin stability system